MKTYEELIELFHLANSRILSADKDLFDSQVSERTLCGALMLHLHDLITDDPRFYSYFVDVEYNRNKGSIKTIHKTITGNSEDIIRINCDLILHSRGSVIHQDNLIAIEMKKSSRPITEKNKDRQRLIALTKESFNDIWSFDGTVLPEHVCRYVVGIYYEISYHSNIIVLEYYRNGCMINEERIEISPAISS